MNQKFFSIFIELLQNIMNYSSERINSDKNREIKLGFITIGKEDGHYFIHTGNRILKKEVQPIADKLNAISPLNKTQLKALYKEQIHKPTNPKAKRAGLGFIDIARKAALPIQYQIEPIDDQYSYFSFKVLI